ncbi:SseB family protein [Amycolatopsis sp. NPDC004625]|uniref:SseB family protein n=1 Tax=Amycolatopsis sp. NPDC004625 TaxID=3154670 RepID=UPI0033A3ECFD
MVNVDLDSGAGLRAEIAAAHGGYGQWPGLVREFRLSVVLVPTSAAGDPLVCDHDGIQWLLAFTDERQLAEWAVVRGGNPAVAVDYRAVSGGRLLDAFLASVGVPAGIAVNIGGTRPVFLPSPGIEPASHTNEGSGVR